MNAQRFAKIVKHAWDIARNGTQPMHRCAHIMVADGLLSITATDGFRLLRQVEPFGALDAMLAVDCDDLRMHLAAARDEFAAQKPDVVAIEGAQDDNAACIMACFALRAGDQTRHACTPIVIPPDREREGWMRLHTHGVPENGVQWASITDGSFANKALAALAKDDRCYLHMDAGWLSVWRHVETRVSTVTTLERSSYTGRSLVLTAPAPDAISTRVRVNPQWLTRAMKLFTRTAEIGLMRDRVVIADRRKDPRTAMVIMGMRPERGDE